MSMDKLVHRIYHLTLKLKLQLTVCVLKLRIISRLIEQLIDKASLLHQELLVASLSLKLAEDDLKLFEDYVSEVDEQTAERQALFDETSEEL